MTNALVRLRSCILHIMLRNTIGIDLRKNAPNFSFNEIAVVVAADNMPKIPQLFIVTSSGHSGWVASDVVEKVE
jgi:hypothetical protein